MKQNKLPKTDSIRELAEFWDRHDLTDFMDELEEVSEPVFVRDAEIRVHLRPQEAKAVEAIATAKGISSERLIQEWVADGIGRQESMSRQS